MLGAEAQVGEVQIADQAEIVVIESSRHLEILELVDLKATLDLLVKVPLPPHL
jgi:hypothetical protein